MHTHTFPDLILLRRDIGIYFSIGFTIRISKNKAVYISCYIRFHYSVINWTKIGRFSSSEKYSRLIKKIAKNKYTGLRRNTTFIVERNVHFSFISFVLIP